MFAVKLSLLLFLMICHVSYCQRRIEGGFRVTANKPYVVYLVKASISVRIYDNWVCGGAIVNSDFIITSAACVEDVTYMYAIAGYNKYVPDEKLEEDRCTSKMKKKIVYTCVPSSYEFNFDKIDEWSQIDIALAKVESSFDFQSSDYEKYCSYRPSVITINHDPKYQKPDTDCMLMGWGHDKKWRQRYDSNNSNSEILRYTPTLIFDKAKCIEGYRYYPRMKPIIEQYMICTSGVGVIDDSGQPFEEVLDPSKYTLLDGCPPERRMDQQNSSCYGQNNENLNADYVNARREIPKTNRTYYNYTTRDYIKKAARERSSHRTRRNGICQNDHGGPLVTWVGTSEVLIGIASVFQIDGDNNCIGPFLHTSTLSNAGFIDCVLNEWNRQKHTRRSEICDSPPNVRGYDKDENHISWKDHPAGPAENELREAKFGPYYRNSRV